MNDLSPRARALIDDALRSEPVLEDVEARRMRARVLGAVATGASISIAGSAAGASVSGGLGVSGAMKGGVFASLASSGLAKTAALVAVIGASAAGASYAHSSFVGERERPVASASKVAPPRAASAATGLPSAKSTAPSDAPGAESVSDAPTRVAVVPDAPRRQAEVVFPSAARAAVNPAPTPSVAQAAASPAPTSSVAQAAVSLAPVGSPSDSGERVVTAPRSTVSDEAAFVAELLELDRARSLLANGEVAGALASLEGHKGTSRFAEERAALRIVALCAAGRRDEAKRERVRFEAAFPRSLQLSRAERACADR